MPPTKTYKINLCDYELRNLLTYSQHMFRDEVAAQLMEDNNLVWDNYDNIPNELRKTFIRISLRIGKYPSVGQIRSILINGYSEEVQVLLSLCIQYSYNSVAQVAFENLSYEEFTKFLIHKGRGSSDFLVHVCTREQLPLLLGLKMSNHSKAILEERIKNAARTY